MHSSWLSDRQGSAWLSLGVKCRFAEEASCLSAEQGSSGTNAVADAQQRVISGMPVQQASAYERDSTSDKLCKDLNEAACTGDLAHFNLSRSGPHLSVLGPLQLRGGSNQTLETFRNQTQPWHNETFSSCQFWRLPTNPWSKVPDLTVSLPLTGSRLQR